MAELRKLSEALDDRESHPTVVTLFVDMVDSTNLKEKTPESNWLSTYAWFYETVTEPITQATGQIVKFTGDGVLAVFTDDRAADAINAAIKVQERIAEGVDNRRVEVSCSIGIATGEVVRFAIPGETPSADYIGGTVDRAARLCSAASPMAIFADEATIDAAIFTRVASQVGSITRPRRTTDDYKGTRQTIALKGFSRPVNYYEILWGMQRFGVKSDTVSQAVIEREQALISQVADAGVWGETKLPGQIKIWNDVNRRGFIQSGVEELYFDARNVVQLSDHLAPGVKAFFVPRPGPRPEGRRTAACVVVLGQTLTGTLVNTPPGRDFGFVRVMDSQGTSLDIYVYLGRGVGGFQVGDKLEFTLTENQLGPTGTNPYLAKEKIE